MKTYYGTSPGAGWIVTVDDGNRALRLNPRYDLRNHSPDGFAWGYGGSGPAQLALALLADAIGDDERAASLYQEFKSRVVARLPQDRGWTLTAAEVARHAMEIDAERLARSRHLSWGAGDVEFH